MKRLGILVAVFVVLVGLLLVQRVQRGKIVRSGPAATVKVEQDKITKVSIHKADGDVELVRTGEVWKLTKPVDYPANGDLIKGMLKSVEELKLEDVISSNPQNRGTYQVDSTGVAVKLWTGDKLALDLVVGKSTSDWTHTFVRYADHNEVYRADGVISYNFNRKPDDWRDKAILNLDEKQVQRIVLEYPKDKKTVTVARADSTHWTVAGGTAAATRADSAAAARLVASAAKLMTVEFAKPEDLAKADWSAPEFRLRVEGGGAPHTVEFAALDENRLLARTPGVQANFVLYKSSLGNLMKKAEELQPGYKPPAPAQPAGMPGGAPSKGKPAKAKPKKS